MADLQVKNVPADLHRQLRRYAKRNGKTLRDLVLEAIRGEVAREEFRERLRGRSSVDLGRPAARGLEEVRAERDRELEP